MMKENWKAGTVYATQNGRALPITGMPDEVFAGKVPGDGICILPEDGKVYAPVNGVVESADGHAYGIAAVLLCNGECFTITGTTADSAVRAGRTIVFRYERKNAGGA